MRSYWRAIRSTSSRGNITFLPTRFRAIFCATFQRRRRSGTLPPPAAATGSVDVLGTIGGLQGRLMGLLRVAERARDTRAAVAAIREARALLEMHGKLAGMIGADGTAILPAVPTTDAGCGPIRVRIAAKLDALASGQGAAE